MKNYVIKLSTTFAAAFLSGCLSAASYDCAKASSSVEKLICADEALSRLDEKLSKKYHYHRNNGPLKVKEAVLENQRNWLKNERNFCKDKKCLLGAYTNQLKSIQETADHVAIEVYTSRDTFPKDRLIENIKFPMEFEHAWGDSYPVCKRYVDMLNAAKYMSPPVCERKILGEPYPFEKLTWTEITEKERVLKTIFDNLTASSERIGNKVDIRYEDWRKRHVKYNAGRRIQLFVTQWDFRKDGIIETIFKRVDHIFGAKGYQCNQRRSYYVEDNSLNNENITLAFRGIYPYGILSFGANNQAFAFKNRVLNSSWATDNARFDIYIYDPLKYGRAEICGINFKRK